MVKRFKQALYSHPRLFMWVGVIALAVLAFVLQADDIIATSITHIRAIPGEAPPAGVYALAALFTMIAALLPLPLEAPALLNGTIFPPINAFCLTYVFAFTGSVLAYEGGRYLGHGPVSQIFGDKRMSRIETLIQTAGWPTLLALRLSPVMAFTALNWASGILALSRPVFYWTTALGIIPGTYIFTIAPQILEDDASFGLYLGIAFAFVAILLGVSFFRLKRGHEG